MEDATVVQVGPHEPDSSSNPAAIPIVDQPKVEEQGDVNAVVISNTPTKEIYQCWICLASSDEDDENAEWIHPCRCRGTAKWVHESCLQTWIDEKQRYNSTLNLNVTLSCQQCNAKYLIHFPPSGRIFYTIEICDRLLYSLSPISAIVVIFGCVYFSAVCYGAFVLVHVMGKDGQIFIEQSDPIFLLIALPSIPIMLFLGKLVRWEDYILKLWVRNKFRLPLFGYILGKPAEKTRDFTIQVLYSRDGMGDPLTICRNFCSSLLLPIAATFVGDLLFSSRKTKIVRTLLGGLTFIITKGIFKILLRQHQFIRQTHRKIANFVEEQQPQQQEPQQPDIVET